MHDNNGGIPPSGLFWTLEIPRNAFRVHPGERRARVFVRDLPVIDTFQFAGAFLVPSTVSFFVEWEATGPLMDLGSGNTGNPTDPDAFLGSFAPAVATGVFAGEEMGFRFQSRPGASSDPLGWAEVGAERNGVFLP